MALWRRYQNWRRRHEALVVVTPDGFRLIYGAASHGAAWASVRSITAFKRDAYTHDCVCLLLALPEAVIEIREDMEGFAALCEAMERRFNLSPAWYLDITTPVFETMPRDLYLHPSLIEPAP
jgi:hypothetical protein